MRTHHRRTPSPAAQHAPGATGARRIGPAWSSAHAPARSCRVGCRLAKSFVRVPGDFPDSRLTWLAGRRRRGAGDGGRGRRRHCRPRHRPARPRHRAPVKKTLTYRPSGPADARRRPQPSDLAGEAAGFVPTGAMVADLRERCGCSVAELADLIQVTPTTVRRWETTPGRLNLHAFPREALRALYRESRRIRDEVPDPAGATLPSGGRGPRKFAKAADAAGGTACWPRALAVASDVAAGGISQYGCVARRRGRAGIARVPGQCRRRAQRGRTQEPFGLWKGREGSGLRPAGLVKRMPTMTNAATLIPVWPWVPVQPSRCGEPWPSVPASATVGGRDARLIRGRVDAGAAAGLRPAGAVITPRWRRRCRCDHARATALARPDVEAQPARPSMRQHQAVLPRLDCRGECWNGLVTRPGDARSVTPGAAHRKRRGFTCGASPVRRAPPAQRTRIDLNDTVGHGCPGRVRDLPERTHIEAETTVGGMGHP